MAAAARAEDLGPHHPVARVGLLVDGVAGGRRAERGPAAARVVLRVGVEELGAAPGAAVRAGVEGLVVLAGERRLGRLLPQDPVLLVAELAPPVLVGLLDPRHVCQGTAVARPATPLSSTVPVPGTVTRV